MRQQRLDDITLRIAAAELEAGRALLREAYEQADPRERREGIKVAADHLRLAARTINDLAGQRGGFI